MTDPRKSPLRVLIEEGMLVISIGVDTLAFACEQGEALRDEFGNHRGAIIDNYQFADSVADALRIEDECGQTDLTRAIDRAFDLAVTSGAVQWADDTAREEGKAGKGGLE